MNATTGLDVWPPAKVAIPSTTANDYYAWGSPLVFHHNIYVGNSGGSESGIIRIGNSAFQTATYIAGVNGAAIGSGVTVRVSSSGLRAYSYTVKWNSRLRPA